MFNCSWWVHTTHCKKRDFPDLKVWPTFVWKFQASSNCFMTSSLKVLIPLSWSSDENHWFPSGVAYPNVIFNRTCSILNVPIYCGSIHFFCIYMAQIRTSSNIFAFLKMRHFLILMVYHCCPHEICILNDTSWLSPVPHFRPNMTKPCFLLLLKKWQRPPIRVWNQVIMGNKRSPCPQKARPTTLAKVVLSCRRPTASESGKRQWIVAKKKTGF